jgi:hypothetical protein
VIVGIAVDIAICHYSSNSHLGIALMGITAVSVVGGLGGAYVARKLGIFPYGFLV